MSAVLACVNRSVVVAFSCLVPFSRACHAGAAIHEMPLPFHPMIRRFPMKNQIALGAIVAAVAVFSQGAFAQASAPSRAEVKAETKAAEKSGALVPAGEGPGAMGKQPSTMSDKTRAERKATTKADAKSGELKPAGEAVKPAGAMSKDDKADKNAGSMTTRADRKAQTKADVKAGKTQPAGEAPQPSGEAPKK